MKYKDAIEWIHGTYKFGSKLGLDNIRRLLNLMNNPQNKLKIIHVAGTNGKGSTCSFIHSILKQSGYKTGLFISPFIESFTERIQINYEEIPEDTLGIIAGKVKACVDKMLLEGYNHPTEFEIVTAIAFQYFFEEQCDLVVLEVGLGGRYDSTNIIENPLISVITSISMDHISILGDTLSKIAYEKAGIIKEKTQVISYPQKEEVQEVLKRVASDMNTSISTPPMELSEIKKIDEYGTVFDYKQLNDLKISILGEHQVKNAIMAIECVNILIKYGYNINTHSIKQGLLLAKWKGRFEILQHNPTFIIDGAHNKAGVNCMVDTISKLFPNKKVIFIFGVMKDKEYDSMIKITSPYAKAYYIVTPDNTRALSGAKLAKIAACYCNYVYNNDTIKKSIQKALSDARDDDIICAFGSLYYIGEVRKMFIK